MASIERTAYPRFRRRPTAQELMDVYTPTPEAVAFARATARGPTATLTLVVLLKAFQRLGYFPRLQDVPFPVLAHVRSCLRLSPDTTLDITPRTLYKHHQSIREFLQVTAWGSEARHVAITAVHEAAQAKDAPADLINVAIEELVRQHFELPAFSALDRLVQRVRAVVHRRHFHSVLAQLSEEDRAGLDALLEAEPPQRSAFNDLKKPPRRPSLAHLDQLLTHLSWLEGLGDKTSLLAGIPPAKIRHFAAEAKALDAAELKKVTLPKRCTVVLCLITRAQAQARDDLVEMFLKRLGRIHRRGQEELERIRARHRETTETLVATLADVLEVVETKASDAELGHLVRQAIAPRGEVSELRAACEAVTAYSGDNYLPLLWRFYKSHRSTLFRLARTLRLASTSQERAVLQALDVALANEQRHGDWLPATVDLSFASEQWQRIMLVRSSQGLHIARRPFEVCVFTYLAAELRSGDVCIQGSDVYADYRDQLLPWEACEPQVAQYCAELGLPATPEAFVQELRTWLASTAEQVDAGYPSNAQLVISEKGEPVLKRGPRGSPSASAEALEAALLERIPERNLLDILANVHHWTPWTTHFGPLSGSEPKLDDAVRRYLLTTFAYGCNLGPAQAARHMRGSVTAHMFSFVNRRHVSIAQQDSALRDLINAYHRCDLPKVWGSGTSAAADGTKYDLAENSLLAEYSIRYGGYGGIAYHHVADTYVALFSHFIPCGVWEAIYIIEGLLKNTSELQPTTVHSDTQGQSTPVYALAHLLGIKLMPRIRNWQDLRFYRPSKDAHYKHIEPLFSETIDWGLIETHWQDLMQVALSIKAGTVSSALLLRKLGTYSRKSRLYQAFRELGRVVRTEFLLRFLADSELRQQIMAGTNKVEAYHGFAKWLHFGWDGLIQETDPEEQEKRIKYNDLVANAVAIQNVIDLTRAVRELIREGYPVKREDLAALSPYQTRHIKRFGDYLLPDGTPEPFDGELVLPLTTTPDEGARQQATA